jgi:hypothetical protein
VQPLEGTRIAFHLHEKGGMMLRSVPTLMRDYGTSMLASEIHYVYVYVCSTSSFELCADEVCMVPILIWLNYACFPFRMVDLSDTTHS